MTKSKKEIGTESSCAYLLSKMNLDKEFNQKYFFTKCDI